MTLKNQIIKPQSLFLATAIALTVTTTSAVPTGTSTIGAGIHGAMPKSDNSILLNNAPFIDIDNDIHPTLTDEHCIANDVGIERLAALLYQHEIY